MVASPIQRLGIVGTGVIGAGWTARALARGLDVIATDPHPEAEVRLRASVDNAWPALERIGLAPGADRRRLGFNADLAEAVADADFIQESAPEVIEIKVNLHRRIDAAATLVPLERLALSPQCGFASGASFDQRLTIDQEIAKLNLLVETAGEVWSDA